MIRRILTLGVLCGALAVAQPANAQGVWFGGISVPGFSASGFASTDFYGGLVPTRIGYPVVAPLVVAPVIPRPVYVARPIVVGGFAPAYIPRPVVRVPLDRAYRRVWRRGW